ncbi:hypothetical protein HDV00_008014 [Rhizophlyctis rosea]|nr:hypothetical protein HDV00_008014 [Rhizophlyctis rosea]
MGLAYSALPPQGPVIITGCDTGFGNLLALRLARAGWQVHATCLTSAGAEGLQKEQLPTLKIFSVDITKPESVQRFKEEHTDDIPYSALINNAGVSGGHVIEWTSMEEYRKIMDVNFFGHVAMTKAFLPLLRKTAKARTSEDAVKPRVVFVSSVAGTMTSYAISAYSSSKHAIEAFAMTLRIEVDPFNILVSVVGPTFSRTPLAINAFADFESRIEKVDPAIRDVYGVETMKKMRKAYETKTLMGPATVEVDEVVRVLEETVASKVPWERYAVGLVAKYLFPLFRLLPFKLARFVAGANSYAAAIKKYEASKLKAQ